MKHIPAKLLEISKRKVRSFLMTLYEETVSGLCSVPYVSVYALDRMLDRAEKNPYAFLRDKNIAVLCGSYFYCIAPSRCVNGYALYEKRFFNSLYSFVLKKNNADPLARLDISLDRWILNFNLVSQKSPAF